MERSSFHERGTKRLPVQRKLGIQPWFADTHSDKCPRICRWLIGSLFLRFLLYRVIFIHVYVIMFGCLYFWNEKNTRSSWGLKRRVPENLAQILPYKDIAITSNADCRVIICTKSITFTQFGHLTTMLTFHNLPEPIWSMLKAIVGIQSTIAFFSLLVVFPSKHIRSNIPAPLGQNRAWKWNPTSRWDASKIWQRYHYAKRH